MTAERYDFFKLRRFALTVGLALLTYALAGLELKSPAEVTVFGVPLIIRRPNLIGVAFVVASMYALVRYWLYAIVFGVSPMAARRMIRRGDIPKIPGKPAVGGPEEAGRKFVEAIKYHFPGSLFGRPITFSATDTSKVQVPVEISFIAWLENIDFTAPIWLNLIALAVYGWALLPVKPH